MLEAILPLKISGDWQEHDLDRARMLLKSLDRFWRGGEPLRLTVIARDEDFQIVSGGLAAASVGITTIRESELLPCLLSMAPVPGWYKQQVLKLAAHRLVRSPFYLLLDADLICAQPFAGDTLVVDGKAVTDWEPRSMHPEWWRGSARVLGMQESPSSPGMSVTPELFSVEICRRLEQHLHAVSGKDAWAFLLEQRNWTEFSLYSSFACGEDIMSLHHHTDDWMQANRRSVRSQHSLWGADGFDRWTPERAFVPGSIGTFIVCQSNTEIAPGEIMNKLGGALD